MSVFFMDFDMAPSVIWARDLYDQMQIRSDFRKWFPRMCQYGFVEGRDYEFVPRVRPQDEGGRTVQRYVKDYRITLEMAKQLYKLHHFHKNDCFRSCEGQHCMGTDHWMQAVIELLHQHKCKSHAPPKRFYESQPPDSLVTTTQIAKEYGCGAKVFNRLLHLHGIQYRANKPSLHQMEHYQKFYENGEYVRAVESTMEQNYNMIDGCANNLPKPRIINGRESVLDKLRIRQMAREKQKSSQEQSADMERNRK